MTTKTPNHSIHGIDLETIASILSYIPGLAKKIWDAAQEEGPRGDATRTILKQVAAITAYKVGKPLLAGLALAAVATAFHNKNGSAS